MDLALIEAPEMAQPLGPREVRVGVRAGGLNFRDVLIALGMYPGLAAVGSEGAGVVLELGPDVEGLAVGDRVMGLLPGFGPVAVTDHRVIARIPKGWSFAEAAAIPVAFLTAYYALVDLAELEPGERVLVHAATGGVGMAAVQLARHIGAEVFATASPAKWDVLRKLGFDEAHIASSRSLTFKERILAETQGRGVDVVLDSLAGELVDASLDLLGRDGARGRFVEMGKTDVRDADAVADERPGVTYRAFEMAEAGPERIAQMLGELLALFEGGALEPLPVTAWDIRRAPEAFRFMSQARHTGKLVLSLPSVLGGGGTVLVTGGTGVLGGLVARHLVVEHGVRRLLLVGRGGGGEGVDGLRVELEGLGAVVEVVACDVGVRGELEGLLGSVGDEHPLCGVVHAAGVLDDGVIGSLTGERLREVLAAKADGAWYLHELTQHMDLGMFVLFSSAAGVFGSPGQGSYAAANAFLDGLAAYRRARGLSGVSLAWGLWEQASGLTGGLGERDLARIARSGMRALSSEEGLRLFDGALGVGESLVLPVPLELAALRAQARAGVLPALFDGLVGVSAQRAGGALDGGLARRLAAVSEGEREGVVLELVRGQVAGVLGHGSAESVDVQRPFKDLGFDSLTAVELRNRLNAATGLRLPATLVFDYPTASAVAGHILGEIAGSRAGVSVSASVSVRALDEPLAIVGMSCRYPGGVRSGDGLWELVAAGRDAIGEFPANRGWDLESLYDPDPDRPGTTYTRSGGFVYDADEFDAAFFGISPREALAMDPQQRLLLEGAWEALEDAGIDPTSLKGTQTGVFAGIIASGYGVGSFLDDLQLEGYQATGMTSSVASGRIAYTLGLEGPAVSVDTACSSSLVALHLAGQALRGGECSLALAGGVTVLAKPAGFTEFARQRVLSVDGRCKSFAAAADGTGFSEGMGMLVLERLSDARRNGHEVLGLVRGSAVNQDGASNGLTAPNGPSQQRVIAQALANASLKPHQVDAVEAHGTGTTLGDPIEAQALIAAYGQGRAEDRPLWLGSIKSNIGHTQAAAGVAGVIKMVMAMRHGKLPRTLHVDRPSTNVDWSAGAVSVLTLERPWEQADGQRRAGVSSFGVSGTNAHVILEEAPAAASPEEGDGAGRASGAGASADGVAFTSAALTGDAVPWVLSGRGEDALHDQAGRLREFVDGAPELELMDVGRSLSSRPVFEHRAVLLSGAREEMLTGLSSLTAKEVAEGRDSVVRGVAPSADLGAVFLFPGQGSQWHGMALELLESSPVFAEQMRACEEALSEHVNWSLEDVLRGAQDDSRLDQVDVLQPVLFAIVVSLAALWRALGVRVAAVAGHSQGEIAAAYVAGGLSLSDATRVVALRSRALLKIVGETETMASVGLGLKALRPRLERWGDRITVSAVNGPSLVGLAGNRKALEELLAELEADGVRARLVPGAAGATHSPPVEVLREELLEAFAPIAPRTGEIPFVSTVTGGPLDTAELNGEYWYRNLREAVQFERVIRALLADGRRAFIEISPHPVLTMAVQETVEEALEDPSEAVVMGSLRRKQGGPASFLKSAAEAWTHGVKVDWPALFAGRPTHRIGLPTYAFQRQRYWLTPTPGTGDAASIGLSAADHPLLGASIAIAGEQGWLFSGRLSLEAHPWLGDHAIAGQALLPGAGFLELALAAAERVGATVVEDLAVERPLPLADGQAVQLQLSVSEPGERGSRSLAIYARPQSAAGGDPHAETWVRHATATLGEDGDALRDDQRVREQFAGATGADAWPPEGAQGIDPELLYDRLADAGCEYGPAFQGVRAAWRAGDELYAEVELAPGQTADAGGFAVHPVLLDAMLHVAAFSELGDGPADELEQLQPGDARFGDARSGDAPRMPSAFSGVRLLGRGEHALRVRIARAPEGDGLSVTAAAEDGSPVLSVEALEMQAVDRRQLRAVGSVSTNLLHELRWVRLAGAPAGGGPLRVAQLDAGADVQASGIELERHPNLGALEDAIAEGAPPPPVVVIRASALAGGAIARADGAATRADDADGTCAPGGELAQGIHEATARALALMQAWTASQPHADAKLVLLTEGAADVTADDTPDGASGRGESSALRLMQAALVGLMRVARSEHPGRFAVVDLDGAESSAGSGASTEVSTGALAGALLSDEPELALRGGSLFVPRVARLTAAVTPPPVSSDSKGTVLIVEDEDHGPGVPLARHLTTAHGARHVVLARGDATATEDVEALQAELREAGCDVRLVACDVSERAQLEELLESIPDEHPLDTVIYTAGLPADGVIDSIDAERLSSVLLPKVGAALNLHALAGAAELILFSSVAAAIGAAGQGTHAALDSFLDALAADRRARGLPGVALAWGEWNLGAEDPGELDASAPVRVGGRGLLPISLERGLELLDVARDVDRPRLLAARWDTAALRAAAKAGVLPAVMGGLVRDSARGAHASRVSLASRLAAAPEAEWSAIAAELVRDHVAGVLRHATPAAVDLQRPFKDAGFDSLGALELRNRLSQATGLKLPATLVFDHPTPAAVAKFLLAKAIADRGGQLSIDEEIDRLEKALAANPGDGRERERIGGRLRALLAKVADDGARNEAVTVEMIESASIDEIVELIQLDLSEA